MAMQDIMAEHQRLSILISLEQVPGFQLNESIIRDTLDIYGLDIGHDALRTHLAWLEEQGLITLEKINNRVWVATITGRGEDVANGRAIVPGVKRPRAGG